VQIRVATEDDVPALAWLRHEYRVGEGSPPEPGFAERFAQWYRVEAPHRVTWLAEMDGQPIGMVSLVTFTRMPCPGEGGSGWAYLSNAFVLAAHRNRGIGGQLLAELLRYADEQGFDRVVLHPSDRAVPFYQRYGFGTADMLLAKVIPR
jgi:GNAT superfamily N-acetyltransferase